MCRSLDKRCMLCPNEVCTCFLLLFPWLGISFMAYLEWSATKRWLKWRTEVWPMQTTRNESGSGSGDSILILRGCAERLHYAQLKYCLLRNICLSLEIRRLLHHHHIITSSTGKCLGIFFCFCFLSLPTLATMEIFWRAINK